ncbi:hypothetical protein PDR89_04015 [Bacillus cereus group sp. Bc002]|nr:MULTISPECIES: hypothetical protein [Bacillus cereus group]ASI78539.1 hypothetical protein BA202_15285 [Bacillus cereus]MCC2485253.1 hypothetical protein [Bacillus pacificus]MDA1605703.1 hypothetical protein [Bacillus cereus group sp. TH208-1LC]MDA1660739.1 hypothetical protein [Bacillus cereus group sp. TH153LC]MDA2139242.1 hypothetical protein [Bacillus cereus group sp. Bc256]
MATLLEECIEALGEDIEILENTQGKMVVKSFENAFPITQWGRVDWSNIENYGDLYNEDEIKLYLQNCFGTYSQTVYIIWDNARVPVIKTNLHQVLNVIYDVTAVSFDTWIYSPDMGFVIEYHHDGDIRIGDVKNIIK